MGVRRAGRVIAFQTLYRYDVTREDVPGLLDFSWMDSREPVSRESLDFARLLVAGTVERIGEVDEAIRRQLEHWDFARLSRVDLAILRMSAYSLLFLPDVPASVTIDEAIDIAREFGTDDSYRFVNGVLDGILKRQPESGGAARDAAAPAPPGRRPGKRRPGGRHEP
jgi:N utilization substance protein B